MIIKSWFDQVRVYNQTSNECRPWYRCQRFRTMINALQHSIGCAKLENCNLPRRSLVLLCLYSGGSTEGFDFDFRFGAACSKCEWPRAFCDNNLCASCGSDDPDLCDCRKTCLKEGVGVGILHRQNCTCQCQYGLGPNCDEPCINPIYYSDNFDPCTAVDPASIDCAIMGEFCPRQCLCRPFPNESETLEK
ncbi:uncharacterized protein LOC112553347 [Pomacea canaliculata]|uniref:uncharacterized protein LOC112553347 n=1 Tax=Pomacea canaliculata TaxID=400727 RepID=UPI000D72B571|nr:uncharacterized protein LOC112553347 [Pomacea canaliculata]